MMTIGARSSTSSVNKTLKLMREGYALLYGPFKKQTYCPVLMKIGRDDWDPSLGRFNYWGLINVNKSKVFDELIIDALIDEVGPPRDVEDYVEWYSISELGKEKMGAPTRQDHEEGDFCFYWNPVKTSPGKRVRVPFNGENVLIKTRTTNDKEKSETFRAQYDAVQSTWWVNQIRRSLSPRDVFSYSLTIKPDPDTFFVSPDFFTSETKVLDDFAINTKANHIRHMIQIYQDKNGTAITTDAGDEREFLEGMAELINDSILKQEDGQDWNDMLRLLLPQIVDISCKYRGYKSNVTEKRVLTTGRVLAGDPVVQIGIDKSALLTEVNGKEHA